jgi:hypothetical protein
MALAQDIDPSALREWLFKTTAYARRKLIPHAHLPVEPEDLAQTALLHLLTEWDENRGAAIPFLFNQVKHEIDRLLRKSSTTYEIAGTPANVVELFEDQTASLDYIVKRKELLSFIDSRDREARVLAEWILFFDVTTSKEIAEHMRVSPTRADYIKRRLRTILREFRPSNEKSDPIEIAPRENTKDRTEGV